MRLPLLTHYCLILFLFAGLGNPPVGWSAEPVAAKPGSSGGRALLIGVTYYEWEEITDLRGPANDCAMLGELLTEHYHFAKDQVVSLTDDVATTKKDKKLQPTYQNIAREFAALAKTVQPNEQVVILLSGHGTQIPDRQNNDDPEPDGRDEVFLPADTGPFDKKESRLKNSIVDDELRQWIKALSDRGARVWLIVDSCHSGTMIRGDSKMVQRRVDPERVLPQEEFAKLRNSAASNTRGNEPVKLTAQTLLNRGGELKNVVAFYAAQSHETAPEMQLPEEDSEAKWQGLLTYTIARLLTPKSTSSELPALTYRELAQQIQAAYRAGGHYQPTPVAEGSDLDREVVGQKIWPQRSRMTLRHDLYKGWTMNAGQLHGITPGSILAVYANGQQQTTPPAPPLGHIKVKSVKLSSAIVEPCEYADQPANDKLPSDSPCEIVFIDYGDLKLKLTVQEFQADQQPVTKSKNLTVVQATINKLAKQPGALFEVSETKAADWRLQLLGEEYYLVSRVGEQENVPASASAPKFGPYPSAELETKLLSQLQQIARAEQLARLATKSVEQESLTRDTAKDKTAVRIALDLVRYRDEQDTQGETIPYGPGLVLREGDRVKFRMKNLSTTTQVYPTLLFIDSGFGISPIYPAEGQLAEPLIPGGTLLTPDTFVVNADTLGTEQLVAIAVKATGKPIDFSGLAQTRLQQARAIDQRQSRGNALQSPLGQLLERAGYQTGPTRGLSKTATEEHSLRIMMWRTDVGAKP